MNACCSTSVGQLLPEGVDFDTGNKKEPYSYSEREFDKGSFTFFTSYNITCWLFSFV